jgi:branched-chain amino acid transport system substrate-binding protein
MKTSIKLFIVLFTSLFIFTGCDKNEDSNGEVTKIQISALLPETGGLSYIGLSTKAALEIAIAEINQDFSAKNSPYRFELKVYDTQLDPTLAVQAMQSIATAGCKLVIGPLSSSEVTAVKPIADSLRILVVSPSSTASSLSIPNDMIYRFVPGEKILAQAMANSIANQGKKALVLISRNDVGSLGLNAAYSSSFASLGIDTALVATFDGNTTDFTTILANVKNQITNYSTTHPLSEIGVVSTSFDETILLFNQAYGDPVLASVNWYGGDGFYKNQNLLANPSASQFAVNTNFYSPGFSLPMANQYLWEPLLTKIYNISGQEGDAFTLNSYDIVKVMAKMVAQNFGVPESAATLRTSFMNASNSYFGVTGPIQLNANGDRSNGTFDYWGVENNNGVYNWYFVGQSQRRRK